MKYALLLGVALVASACTNPTTQSVIAQGQLYCAMATATGPLVVALANTSGVPVTVTDKGAKEVAAACAVINAIPVMPPPVPASVPVVAAAVPATAS